MSIKEYLEKMKTLQSDFVKFIEDSSNTEDNYQNLTTYIFDQKILDSKTDICITLHIISTIVNNHNRNENFFEKIEKIINFLSDSIKKYISNTELFNIFKDNKRILLFLIEEKLIIIDDYIFSFITNNMDYRVYFYPEIKPFITEDYIQRNPPRFSFSKHWTEEVPPIDKEKQKIGENENKVYQMIRKDLIDEFISYANLKELNLKERIKSSFYETNQLLIVKSKYGYTMPTLIEYAAFYGSIQIFKYLFLNGADVNSSIWIYAVHGNNPELFSFLEEKKVEKNEEIDLKVFEEAIKCHHNDVANYFLTNYLQNNNDISNVTSLNAFKYFNFNFMDENLDKKILFGYACEYDYYFIVELILKTEKIDINQEYTKIIKCISKLKFSMEF